MMHALVTALVLSAAEIDQQAYTHLVAASAAQVQLQKMLLCVDKHTDCGSWVQAGECAINPSFMLTDCKRSCNGCVLSQGDGSGAFEVALYAARNLLLACLHPGLRLPACSDISKRNKDLSTQAQVVLSARFDSAELTAYLLKNAKAIAADSRSNMAVLRPEVIGLNAPLKVDSSVSSSAIVPF